MGSERTTPPNLDAVLDAIAEASDPNYGYKIGTDSWREAVTKALQLGQPTRAHVVVVDAACAWHETMSTPQRTSRPLAAASYRLQDAVRAYQCTEQASGDRASAMGPPSPCPHRFIGGRCVDCLQDEPRTSDAEHMTGGNRRG